MVWGEEVGSGGMAMALSLRFKREARIVGGFLGLVWFCATAECFLIMDLCNFCVKICFMCDLI